MPDGVPASTRPIELVTENGFSIVRVWEINRVPPPTEGKYHFMVRNPQNLEREIIVSVAAEAVAQIELQTAGRILLCSSFWICCAERHLANYLSESDDYPSGQGLCV